MKETVKKKIIIVNNNMKVGGVQKSLCNLLWSVYDEYDVTLCLFSKRGSYINEIPSRVKVIESRGPFRYFGISQAECKKHFSDKVKRGALALLCKIFGRSKILKLMLKFEGVIQDEFDCAVAFLHNGRKKSFYGGVQEYVLKCVKANRKIAFLHCDYEKCGANNENNNCTIEQFDLVAACSEGCKSTFVSAVPRLKEKCTTVRNFHRYEEIHKLADNDTINYDVNTINLVIVSRLSHEKGIDRAINVCAEEYRKGHNITLHILGEGPMRGELEELAARLRISDRVIFHGEQSNPYRYMKNADILLMTSYHEAAPMVIDEAISLGLPVLTMQTTSSDEMVKDTQGGWVCENNSESFAITLDKLLNDLNAVELISNNLKKRMNERNNNDALAAFRYAVTGENLQVD